MKTLRPQKRSVSPFGTSPEILSDSFQALAQMIQTHWPLVELTKKTSFHALEDVGALPAVLNFIVEAPANDAPILFDVCSFLVRFRETFDAKGLSESLHEAMQYVFDQKTELFMVDHFSKEQCEKMGWTDEFRDVVLFAKERDALVGRYFAPVNELQPGRFSAFINRWAETKNPDRALHFLDFCAGSKNPTFEHYLLFAHPALARVVSNKSQLKTLFEVAAPVISKLTSPTWQPQVTAALSL
ncbi:MAG: hypothetical protein JST16_02710 [Bdellovibrionales bacterium]|nr:hypothetical protein [Bdellovibrionales bacterium]